MDLLIDEIAKKKHNGYKTVILCGSKPRGQRLISTIKDRGIEATYRNELQETKQNSNSYQDYQTRFQRIVDLATPIRPIDEPFLIEKFIGGLDKSKHGYAVFELSKPEYTTFNQVKTK